MPSSFVLKKKDIISSVTTGFLPQTVLVPLCQEKDVLCKSVVKKGEHVEEGQIIAEDYIHSKESAKIHSPIPGIVKSIKKCSLPNGKCGEAIEIALSGNFSYIGKVPAEIKWQSLDKKFLLDRVSAHGVINTFSMREPCSLAENISALKTSNESRIFVRLYDEDLSCQTDSVLARSLFKRIVEATDIISEIISPKEIVFAYPKSNGALVEKLLAIKTADEIKVQQSVTGVAHAPGSRVQFVSMNEKNFPCGTKNEIAARYKKNMRLAISTRELCEKSLFVDCQTLLSFYDAVAHDVPSMRVHVTVSGDCLKSSAVLKVCVGSSFKSLAQSLGLEEKKIGKIIVNGYMNGFSVPSLETPVTKYVKSVAFISQRDIADYSEAYCTSCGNCRNACPAQIYPNLIFAHLVNNVKVPNDFIRSALLCTECGLCNSVCPVKLPLFQSVKILKERQNEK